jgi:citrate synthase
MDNKITIIDRRTGQTHDLPIVQGAIPAIELQRVRGSDDDPGLMSYDPGFKNTASCRSEITFIDGARSILRYRGYPIESLASGSSYLETAYLLIHGELPSRDELGVWVEQVSRHRELPECIQRVIKAFPSDAHPMGVLISSIAALSTCYPEAKRLDDPQTLQQQTYRLIGMMPTIAAYSLRHRRGLDWIAPDESLSYTGNFLRMLGQQHNAAGVIGVSEGGAAEEVLDVIFLLHADLEQNCSANVMRCVASSLGDPYCATAAAIAALSGPRHGGANERVLEQLRKVGSKDNVPALLERVKAREERLMGFGHRVYREYDPRARILKQIAEKVFAETGSSPLLEVAKELERIALEDDFFVQRRLYPNVDFYSGIILDAIGFPANEFTVLFALARTAGWLAQYREFLADSEQSIARPRQIYVGQDEREYVPIANR